MGQRVRMLGYLLSHPPPQGHDVVFTAVQSSMGMRPSLTLPIQTILDHLGLECRDVMGNTSGMREMLRCVASFLRFKYPHAGEPPQLYLPYLSMKTAPPKLID